MIIFFSFLFTICYMVLGGWLVLHHMSKNYLYKRSFIEVKTWGDFLSYIMIWPIIAYALQKHKEKKMKIRSSFVSNSSSSSFVCICPKDIDLSNLTNVEREIFDICFMSENILGVDAFVASEYINSEDFQENDIFMNYCANHDIDLYDREQNKNIDIGMLKEDIYNAIFALISKIEEKSGTYCDSRGY